MRVAVLDDYMKVALELGDWSSLEGRADITVFDKPFQGEDEAAEKLAPFEAIVGMRERTPFPAPLLERLPNLKILVTTGMRNASFDMDAARARDVAVCGTNSQGTPTAELTWALIFGLVRNIPAHQAAMRDGRWQTVLDIGLHGRTLVLLGLGRLGGRVAAVGKALEMNIIAWSENLTDERAAEHGAKRVEKADLLAQSDIVSIHLVLSDRTRGLLGPAELALMKPSAYLVNTSRGPIVDETALLDVLRDNRIAGAGIDVYDQEPLPADHPIRRMHNVVLAPHVGYVVEENYRDMYTSAAENIGAFIDGAPVRVLN